jgi:hypothetical protein
MHINVNVSLGDLNRHQTRAKIMQNSTDKTKYIVFNSTGVTEKEIAATAVVSSIKSAYPDRKIIVVSKNPEVWLHNPDVYRIYRVGNTPYFFEDFIENKKTMIFWQDPFATDDHIHKRKNLIEIWCDLCKVSWNRKEPCLYFTFREFEATERMMRQNLKLNLRQSLCAISINKEIEKKRLDEIKPQEFKSEIINSTSKNSSEEVKIKQTT